MHKDGVGVKQDASEAMKWYQKGLDAGDKDAEAKMNALNDSAQQSKPRCWTLPGVN